MVLPFGLLLAAMALGPVYFGGWWSRHCGKTAGALGAVTVGYYLFFLPPAAAAAVGRAARDYTGFMALAGSLFVISGGIHITVKNNATPRSNVLFLLLGALLANVLGTMGASLLLIRPWLRMNARRPGAHQVVFFIFIVSNAGGCLTAFGNPPLFLGHLMGVPLWWVAEHCWPMWLCGTAWLLAAFYFTDCRHVRLAPVPPASGEADASSVEGLLNLVFLAIVLGAVFVRQPPFLREGLMGGAAVASWFATRRGVHEANQFDFHPIRELAVLFLGIFATMIPALDLLQARARALVGAEPSASLVYWASGALSSVLDNAPAYMSFLAALFGTQGQALGHPAEMAGILAQGRLVHALAALSVAAVFFGGCTYVGNAPNLMVKAIAERQGVRLPGFLGYVFKWAMPALAPMLVLIWLVFFR